MVCPALAATGGAKAWTLLSNWQPCHPCAKYMLGSSPGRGTAATVFINHRVRCSKQVQVTPATVGL